jgi:uncharacterized protein YjaZ
MSILLGNEELLVTKLTNDRLFDTNKIYLPMKIPSSKGFLLMTILQLILTIQTYAQPNYPRNPQEAKLIYTDLVHFVEAYNEIATNTDTIQVLQTLYFDRGSVGLTEFVNRHQLTPELLKQAMSADPDRYALIPGFLSNIARVEEEYQSLMQDYDEALPIAIYPPTYLLVGANRGIGQASQVGQLITVTRPVDSIDKLRGIMAHELSHFQQAMAMGGQKYAALYSSPNNMLGLCLREGGAEFLASLVVGDITQSTALDYIEEDEQHLKEQFLLDLETQDKDFWLWASIGQKTYPKLLGYAMGYKICKYYYENALDKRLALDHILKMEDAEAFIVASGYFKL